MAVFSFQMNKNITAGEGGMIVTDDETLYLRANAAHDLGVPWSEGLPIHEGEHTLWGAGPRMSEALDDVRIAEFGSYAAGPHIGKLLANFGATVIHVESRARPDGFRMQYPPYKDNKPGIDSGGCFAYFNDSKLGVTLDLKNPRGVELARRLVSTCDVVIENMPPGVMARIGLGYDALKAVRPGLVVK